MLWLRCIWKYFWSVCDVITESDSIRFYYIFSRIRKAMIRCILKFWNSFLGFVSKEKIQQTPDRYSNKEYLLILNCFSQFDVLRIHYLFYFRRILTKVGCIENILKYIFRFLQNLSKKKQRESDSGSFVSKSGRPSIRLFCLT